MSNEFESCTNCIHADDAEPLCILRLCKHAIAETKECYMPKVQPSFPQRHENDCISRADAIDALCKAGCNSKYCGISCDDVKAIEDLPSAQPEQHGRVFKEIVVEYPTYSTYPEYEGKPYFSIKYTENGQGFIGYGTFKPEVLSEYLKEYFIPSAQPQRWIPVTERLPKEKINPNTQDYDWVLCSTTFGDVRAYHFGRGRFLHGCGDVTQYVTAWCELPEPYREEGADE